MIFMQSFKNSQSFQRVIIERKEIVITKKAMKFVQNVIAPILFH